MPSLVDLVRASAERFGSHPAIVSHGHTLTHAAFGELSDRVATGLIAHGVEPGERVALYCINSDVFAAAYFGILKTGATVVPINLLLTPREIAFILNDAGATTLIYHELFAEQTKATLPLAPSVRRRVRIGATVEAGELAWPTLLASASTSDFPRVSDDDVAAILYTSGTTGHPKGAMLLHRNLAANVESIREALRLEPGKDVLLCVLPMFHAFAATVCMIFPLTNGCTLVPLPKFDPQGVADAVAANKVTLLAAVPSMYSSLLRLPDGEAEKFESLHFFVSGGAAMPVEIMRQCEAKFGKLIYEGDGPTECSPVTCVNPIGGTRKPASVGLPVPRVEMKIVDDMGNEVPHGTVGEIVVRGPNVMKGYWKQPEETRRSFFGEWFRTGDLGTEDDDGYFFIVDRKKDMLIVNGMNVYPRTVEEVLFQHPAVREAAVVGEPDPLHGEIPVAYVAAKEGAELTAQQLREHCREHLGRYQIPRKFHLIPQLPRNAAGKVLKRELRMGGEYERGVDRRAL